MRDDQLGRLLRMVRLRQNWPQAEVSKRAGISRSSVCRIEGGQLRRYRVETVQLHGAALGLRIELTAIGRGGEVPRLLDEEHATIVEWLAKLLTAAGWEVVAEASYSIYGERGRIDLLAYHPPTRTLLVVEIKTELTDLQALFGSLSVKERMAPAIAASRGWDVRRTSILLAVADMPATRALIRRHATLFARFERHALSVRSQLRAPRGPAQLLLYVGADAASDGRRPRWLATRRRVRRKTDD